MIEAFELQSGAGMIRALLAYPDNGAACPCVVLSHGLISSKESTKYVALSERFLAAGVASCRFDYHGCGESDGQIAETTLTIRLGNLSAIVEYVTGHERVDAARIGIIGSSFGGTTALVKAARDERIRCVSLWATPYRLEKEGDGSIDNVSFKDDIYDDFRTYDILSEARGITHGLVIHGGKDETVPFEEGKTIYGSLREPKKLEILPNGDHIFSDPDDRELIFRLALDWFQEYLVQRQ